MDKQEFLLRLRRGLSGLPQDEIEERLTFYSEMIDDRMEEGLCEVQAVAAAGSIEEIAYQILDETPFANLAKKKMKPARKMKAREILLLAAGLPIWFSLLMAVLSVVFSLYASLWAVIVSLWVVFVAVAGCAVGAILGGVGFGFAGFVATGVAAVGAGFVCAGLAIFLFFGCMASTKGAAILTKKCSVGMKMRVIRRGQHNG